MSSTGQQQPQQRDIVYCHQCQNEWYRSEHGLVCPECDGDFTEIVEADNDPRADEQQIPADDPPHAHGEFYAPDPDEGDIDDVQWVQTGPDTYRLRGTYRTQIPIGPGGRQQAQEQGQAGLMNLVGNVLQGMMGTQQPAQQPQMPQQQGQLPQTGRALSPQLPGSPLRPASAPGSPPPMLQRPGGNGPFVQHGSGPGFSYTIATSSNSNFGGANLFPRNANAPQPFQPQPDHIERMLQSMVQNIGAMPGMMGGGMHMGGPPPGMRGFDEQDDFMGGPFILGGPGGMRGIANILQMFGPPGGVAGDAVYSQEALDRIITQLMEQHQTGNAPGPASEAAIKSLPTKQISEEDFGDSGKVECSICMEQVELGGTVTVLPCHHWFHAECIRAWLSEHDTCPHCRQGIMPKDGDGSTSARPREPNQEPMHDMRSPEYTRPSIPGAFPFPRQSSTGSVGGDGSQQNPFTVPDSPTTNRRNSTGGERRRSSGSGMFSRMRDAFGRGDSSGSGSGGRG